jgi:hypothetical protein
MAWLSVILMGACLGFALVHGARVVRGGARRPGELAHMAMALGMGAMFAPAQDPVPRLVWVLVFAATAVGALGSTVRERGIGGEPGHRLVGSIAMLFMLLVGHQEAGQVWRSLVAIVLAGTCGWHALRCADRLRDAEHAGNALVEDVANGHAPVERGGVALAVRRPRLVDVGHVAVAAAMALMLLGAV